MFRRSGHLDALGVLANLQAISSCTELDRQLWTYLTYPQDTYPFYKVLIGRQLLSGSLSAAEETRLRNKLGSLVEDE